jgi:hypothetical protein
LARFKLCQTILEDVPITSVFGALYPKVLGPQGRYYFCLTAKLKLKTNDKLLAHDIHRVETVYYWTLR